MFWLKCQNRGCLILRIFWTFSFIDFFSLDRMDEELSKCSFLFFVAVDIEDTLIILSIYIFWNIFFIGLFSFEFLPSTYCLISQSAKNEQDISPSNKFLLQSFWNVHSLLILNLFLLNVSVYIEAHDFNWFCF